MLPQKWNGRSFEDTTLASLGLVFQLGHINGDACPNPTQAQDLTVFDRSSAYRLVVRYCACEGAPLKRIQLFRARWFSGDQRSFINVHFRHARLLLRASKQKQG